MANKITLTSGLKWTDGKDTVQDTGSITFDQEGSNVIFATQAIDDTAEAIVLGDVADPGYILFKNMVPVPVSTLSQADKDTYNTNNTIKVGNDNAVATVVASLLPGQSVVIPTSQTTWYGLAATAGLPLLVMAMDK